VTQITLPNGNTLLKNTYDAQGRVISQTNGRGFTWQFAYNTPAAGQTTITDARGNTTIHMYDSSLRIVGILDALGHTTNYAYDSNNDRTSVTSQNGNVTSFSYDANGNVTGVTDPLSKTTAFTYDANNNLLSVTNPKGQTTSFSYDSHGNLTGIQDALGDKTTVAYDSFGELTGRTDAKGNATSFSYGGASDLTDITDALGKFTALSYDGDGRLVSVTDPNSHTATSIYDALGRLTKVADPLGNQTVFAYDAVGNLLAVTDANGHATRYAYDATDNLSTVTDALGHVTKYAYDKDNNRVGFTNAKGNTTTYQYDALNRLIGTSDPLSFATAYSYDPVGNVLAVTDAKAQTNRFVYDALNRLISIAYADHKNVAYNYDADGNRASMVDWTGTTSYAYDALDRLASVTFPGNKTVGYSYDANGGRASITYPDGKIVAYRYDADERLSTETDWLSHVSQYTYDPAGNLSKTQYPNKANIRFTYDKANRLTSVVNTTVGVPPLAFNYTLDAVGNRAAVTEGGIPTSYGYDALNELTSAQTWFLKTAWTYDSVGNRLSQASPLGVTNYAYDASDRLLKAGTRTFTFDADGNQTSVTDAFTHLKRIYKFDAANRLVSVDGGLTSTFVYDGDGNRVSQSAGGSTQNYVNDVAAALPVVLQDGYGTGPPSSYVYGLNLIETSQGRDNDFYQYDGLGSVIQLTDATGRPEVSYFYDAWGNSILPAPPTNPFRFAGQAIDAMTGLYYLRARYYDPSSGTFLSRDPSPGFVAQPQARNRYRYSLGNPIRFTDPSGLNAVENVNQIASVASVCGTNCSYIWSAVVDAVTSAGAVIAEALQEGWNSATSIGGVDAGDTVLQTGSAVVVNPDTVSAEISTIQSQQALIQSAAGFLGQNYSKSDLQGSYGLVCANSDAGGVCLLRGESYVEGLIMKDAAQQGHMPGFPQ
jgi:RHS repeat-associated protein